MAPRVPTAARRRSRAALPTVPPGAALDPARLDERLVAHHEPDGVHTEQYRALRTNLQAVRAGDGARTLLFASAFPEEGKSITVANVGLCLSENPAQRVCIVDADMRMPSLGDLFGIDGRPGLSDVILDRVSPERALRPTHRSNLFILPAGRETDQVPEAIGSEYMRGLVSWLKQRFDEVLFDSPPCLAFADAADLSAAVDGVVFVVAVGKTHKREVEQAVARMRQAGADIIGSFVTGGFVFRKEPLRVGDDPF